MKKIVVMFPGQASQYVGMGQRWLNQSLEVRERFEEASDALGYDLAKLCLTGPAAQLNRTDYTQPALLTLGVATYEAMRREHGLAPSFLAGHSIGEWTALTAAGVFPFADAVRLARIRGEAMASCDAGAGAGMAAVRELDAELVESLLETMDPEGRNVQIANYNSPSQTIIAGNAHGLRLAEERLTELGAKYIRLNVSGPFHSRYMSGAEERLAAALSDVTVGQPAIPVMCGQKGRLYAPEDDIPDMLVRHLTQPVRWTQMVRELARAGAEQWLEIGPKQVLKRLTLETLAEAEIYALDEEADYEAWVASGKRDPDAPNLIGLCMGAAAATRNTNWDAEAYQRGVVECYRQIKALHEQAEQEGREPAESEMKRALSLLQTIFETKGTPHEERQARIRGILAASGEERLWPEIALAAGGS